MPIRKFKLSIAEYLLKRKLQKQKRFVKALNLEQCHSVLVLGNFIDDPGAVECQRLISYLERLGKEVFCIYSYKPGQKKIDNIQIPKIQIINKYHLNFLYTPVTNEINSLMDREFNLLVDLSFGDVFPIKYLFSLSKAQFKVGSASSYRREHADMTIEMADKKSTADLITQLKHYLNLINKQQHVA